MVMTPIFKSPETPEPSEEILEAKKLSEEKPEEKPEGNFPQEFDNIVMNYIMGTVDFASDVVTAPFRLAQGAYEKITDEEDPNVQKQKVSEGWTSEADENIYIEDYNRYIKAATKMGLTSTVTKNGKQVLATFDNLTDAQKNEVLENRKKSPTTTAGIITDVVGAFGVGAAGFKMAPKNIGDFQINDLTRAILGDAFLEQVILFSEEDKFSNLANAARDWAETFDGENPFKSVLSNPVTNYIAAEQDDSELELRAKTLVVSSIMTGASETIFKFAGWSLGAANEASKKMYGKTVDQLSRLQAKEFVDKFLPILRKDRVRHNNGASLILGLGLPNFSFLHKQANKLSEDEAQLIKQTTKADAGILSRGASVLRRIKQRWFTSNGYAPRKAWEEEQKMIRRTRALRTEADSIAKRLQYYLDEAIHEYDGDILKNITSALETNLSDVKPEIHLEVLQRKFDLPEEVAREVLNGRNMIDRLSQMVLDSNIGTEPVRAAIAENLGTYTRRSYRMFEEKGFIPSNSAKRKATEFFRNKYLAQQHNININKIDSGLEWEDLGLSAEDIQKGTTYAEREVEKFLKLGEKNNFDQFLGSVMKVNNSLLKGRKDIPKVLRDLMGEVDHPPLKILQTANNLIQLVESNKYYNSVLELGGSVPENKEVYDQALNKARSMLRHIDLSIIPEDKLSKGEFVNVRSESTNQFTVGKIIRQTKEGYEVEIKDFKTQKTTTQIVPVNRVKQTEDDVIGSYDLELIPRTNVVKRLADEMYLNEGNSYTKPTYIFDQDQGDAGIFNTQIDMPGNPLHGKFTTKEYATSLAGLEDYAFMSTTIKNSPRFNAWRYIKGVSQSLKTVWDLTTQLRNNLGGMQFALNNGLNPFKNGKLNASILWKQMGNVSPEEFTRQYNKLQELGIVNTSVMGGEWQALMKSAQDATPQQWEDALAKFINKVKDPIWKGKPSDFDKVKTKWYQMPQKMYMAIDDFYKMNAYAQELDFLKKARPDAPIEQLENEAAELIRNTFPNYDLIPKGFKGLRDLPLGNFVAFTPEIIRTQAHILARTIKELQTPGLRVRGAKRLAGGLVVHGGWASAGTLSQKMLSWDDERTEAINVLTEAPWSDRHNKIPVEINGKLGVINPMYLNPYDVFHGFFQDIQTAYAKGEIENLDADTIAAQATVKALQQMMSFATDASMVADVAFDIGVALANDTGRTGSGKEIFKTKDITGIIEGSIKHLLDTVVTPGAILDGKKLLYDLPRGSINKQTGDPLDMELVVMEMLTGINVRPVNPEHSLVLAASRYKKIKGQRIKRPKLDEEGDPIDWANSVMRQNAEKFIVARDAHRKINAVKNMGINSYHIEKILAEQTNLSQQEIKEIQGGIFTPFKVTEGTKKLYEEYYKDSPDASKIMENITRYIQEIEGMSLHSYQMTDIEKAKRLQNGKGTGFYRFGPAEDYDDLAERYSVGLKFAEGGKVEGVSNVKADPKERRDPYSGQAYADTAEIKEEIEGFLILDNDRLKVVNGGKIPVTGKTGKLADFFHATLKEFKKLKNVSSDLGTHIGSSEQAANRLENKIINERMEDVLAERDLDLDVAYDRLKKLKNSKADPEIIKGVENEIRLLERDMPLDNFLKNARMLRVSVNKGKSLVTEDAGEWRELDSSIDALLHSDLVKNPDGTKDTNFIRRLNRQRKKAEDVKYEYDDPRDFYTSTEAKKIRNKIVKLIKEKGYDSIEYKNLVESPYAAEGDELKSYIIFDPENITIEEDELIKSEEQLRKPRAEGGYEKIPKTGKLKKLSKLIGAFKKPDPMGFRNISEDIIEDPNFPSKGQADQMRSALTGGKGGRLPEEQVKTLGGIPKAPEEELEMLGIDSFLKEAKEKKQQVTKEQLKEVITENKKYTELEEDEFLSGRKLSEHMDTLKSDLENKFRLNYALSDDFETTYITHRSMPDVMGVLKKQKTSEGGFSYTLNTLIKNRKEKFVPDDTMSPFGIPESYYSADAHQFGKDTEDLRNRSSGKTVRQDFVNNLLEIAKRRKSTVYRGYQPQRETLGLLKPNKYKIQSLYGSRYDPVTYPDTDVEDIDFDSFPSIPVPYKEFVVSLKHPVRRDTYSKFDKPVPLEDAKFASEIKDTATFAGEHFSKEKDPIIFEAKGKLPVYHLRISERQMIVDPENADPLKHQTKLNNFDSAMGGEDEYNVQFGDFAKEYYGSPHPTGKAEKIIFVDEFQSDIAEYGRGGKTKETDLKLRERQEASNYMAKTATGKVARQAGITPEEFRLAYQRWDTKKHNEARVSIREKIEDFDAVLDSIENAAREKDRAFDPKKHLFKAKARGANKRVVEIVKQELDSLNRIYKAWESRIINAPPKISDIADSGPIDSTAIKKIGEIENIDGDRKKILKHIADLESISPQFLSKELTPKEKSEKISGVLSKILDDEEIVAQTKIVQRLVPEETQQRKLTQIATIRERLQRLYNNMPSSDAFELDDYANPRGDIIPVTQLVKDNTWVQHGIKNLITKMVKQDKDRVVFSSGEGQLFYYKTGFEDEFGSHYNYQELIDDPDISKGLRDFYNKTIVNEAKKVLKKIDPDAVEVIEIDGTLTNPNTMIESSVVHHHLTIKNTPKLRAFVEGAEGTPEGFTTFGKRKGGIVRQGKYDGGKILTSLKNLGSAILDVTTSIPFSSETKQRMGMERGQSIKNYANSVLKEAIERGAKFDIGDGQTVDYAVYNAYMNPIDGARHFIGGKMLAQSKNPELFLESANFMETNILAGMKDHPHANKQDVYYNNLGFHDKTPFNSKEDLIQTIIKQAPNFKSAEAFKITNNFNTGGKVLRALANTRR